MKPINHKENRERFGAVSEGADLNINKCPHEKLVRLSANDVGCKNCHAGWRFIPIPPEILSRIEQ